MSLAKRLQFSIIALTTIYSLAHSQSFSPNLNIDAPMVVLENVPFDITISAVDANDHFLPMAGDTLQVSGIYSSDGSRLPTVVLENGQAQLSNVVAKTTGAITINIQSRHGNFEETTRSIPAWLSLLPPVMAITMALVVRQVLLSLFVGVWLGAIFVYDYSIFLGFLHTVDHYIINALVDKDHISILVFSLTLGGMVGVISRGGGTRGIVQSISKFARTSQSGQLSTWAMGMLIFFDDYANTLIVGNTMRPVTDRLKISREKLSYIVDSTAAPIAAIAPISTWIGYEVGLIDQVFKQLNISMKPYSAFIASIPFSTYSILALVFVLIVAITRRDFGPMRQAEKRASEENKVLSDTAMPLTDAETLEGDDSESIPHRWYNGLVPILVVIFGTVIGLYFSGISSLGKSASEVSIRDIIDNADSYAVLTWASFLGLLTAMIMIGAQRLLPLVKIVDAAVAGYRSMLMAAFILTLAWAIGNICTDLHTAAYVVDLTRNILSPAILPTLTFLIAAVVSFSTGSSWATMAIMIPIVIPLAHQLPIEQGLEAGISGQILIATIGAVLAGVIFGDHCSPISDTTVMSSMASAADHIDHVRTQLPYALVVSAVALLTGFIPAGFGWGGWSVSGLFLFALGIALLVGVLFFMGKRSVE